MTFANDLQIISEEVRHMKRIITLLLAVLVLAGGLCGCSAQSDNDGRLKIVCTVFPLYDWMRELTAGSENVELILIADNGVDMHSYQPTTGDIVDISTCDMLVYTGGQSDEWVDEIVERSGNEHMMVAHLIDELGDRALCAAPHEHNDHDDGHDGHHHDEDAKDEHIWLSAINAGVLCERLCGMLCELDSENAPVYEANAAEYISVLNEMDEQYRAVVDGAQAETLLFADRFPFRYLANDYEITYCAAFDGCEAETEASFETVAHLAAELSEHSLDWVLIIEGSEDRLARTIIGASDRPDCGVLTLDSLQSITAEDIADGVTYLSVMEENLAVLRQALGCSTE